MTVHADMEHTSNMIIENKSKKCIDVKKQQPHTKVYHLVTLIKLALHEFKPMQKFISMINIICNLYVLNSPIKRLFRIYKYDIIKIITVVKH